MLRYYFYDALQGNLPLTSRKPLQPDNTKHTDEEDSCSVASSYPFATLFSTTFFLHFSNDGHQYFLNNRRTAASVRTLKGRAMVASAPTFRCSERAEKRKEVAPLILLPV